MKDSEIKIGINIGKAGKRDRGISVYTRNLLHEMTTLEGNHKFVFLHYPESSPSDGSYETSNSNYYPLPYTDNGSPLKTIFNEQVLNPIQQARLGLDIAWHPHNRSQLFSPCTYACTLHDILPVARPDLAGKYLNSPAKQLLFLSRTLTARNADVVITVSEFSRQEIISRLKVRPDKVVAIHSGVDRNTFHPDMNGESWDHIKQTHSLPEKYVLTTGSYAPHKNLPTLVEAYAHSQLPAENVGLVMVGPNDATGYRIGYQQVEKRVIDYGLSAKVRLLPSVSEADLVAIYSHATFFAIASLYEGFGFTALEAMACETPVVASCLAAIPEICQSAAIYVDPTKPEEFTQQFNLLNANTDLQQELITKGRKQVQKFDWRNCATETLAVLVSAAHKNKPLKGRSS
ncbi:glycosyltransferase family 4 protein [Candidatus Amesbacteria bacterium]|nr:glycosyltransferase family 4 protein [Candidatus Amesbacteria bacterium]